MADNNSGGQGGQNNSSKQSGLSWSQPSSAKPVSSIGTSAGSQAKSSPLLKPAAPATAVGASGNRKLVMFFAGGVLVGGLLAWSWFSLMPEGTVAEEEVTPGAGAGSQNTGGASDSTTGNGALPGATIGNEALVVPSPQDAGLSVTISSATVNSPTWVVVYESNNGVRGNALGAALFFPGGGTKKVNLLRATVANRTYLVGRHVDNGDKQFSLTNDQPVVNAAGNPVYVELKTR